MKNYCPVCNPERIRREAIKQEREGKRFNSVEGVRGVTGCTGPANNPGPTGPQGPMGPEPGATGPLGVSAPPGGVSVPPGWIFTPSGADYWWGSTNNNPWIIYNYPSISFTSATTDGGDFIIKTGGATGSQGYFTINADFNTGITPITTTTTTQMISNE